MFYLLYNNLVDTESQSNQLERNWEALRAKFTTRFYSRLGIIPELLRFALNFIAVGIYVSSSYTNGFQKSLGALEVSFSVNQNVVLDSHPEIGCSGNYIWTRLSVKVLFDFS